MPEQMNAGWHVVPDNVMLTGPGQHARIDLVHFGVDGQPSGRAVPAGLVVESNVDAGIDASLASTGAITVTGGAQIGEEIAKIVVEGEIVGPIWLTSVRLQPGVTVVDQRRILFPTADNSDPAPFGLEEVSDRLAAPLTPDVSLTTGTVMPYVLIGAPPTVGQLLVASGATPMMGRVVERPGLPTLARDGLSLVSVELVPLDDVYYELQTGASPNALEAFGLATSATAATTGSGTTAGARSAASSTRATAEDDEPACKGSISGGVPFDAKALKLAPSISAKGDGVIASVSLGEQRGLIMEMGLGGTITYGPELKLQAAAIGKLECTLDSFDIPVAIPPPIAPVVLAKLKSSLVLELEAKAAIGPALTIGTSCTYTFELRVGFSWTTLRRFRSLNSFTQQPLECKGIFEASGVSDAHNAAGVPIAAEASFTMKVVDSLDLTVGGATAELFGKIFDIPNLGRFSAIEGYAGPKATVALENSASVLSNKAAGSKIELAIVGGLSLKMEPFELFANEVLGIEAEFSVDLLSVEVPVETYVKPAEPSSVSATVDGEEQSSPFEVEIGDVVDIRMVMKPADALTTVEPEDATDYEIKENGDTETTEQFDWTVTGGYTVTANRVITKEMCDEFGTGTTYGLVTSTEFSAITVPAWAGTFVIKCGKKIEFEPPVVELTKHDDTATTTMTQSGYDTQRWEFRPDFAPPAGYDVSFAPASGTFDPSADEVELELRLICGEDADDSETVDYRVYVDEISVEALLTVTLDCRDEYIRVPEEVRAPANVSIDTRGRLDDQWNGPGVPGTGFLNGTESTDTTGKTSVLSTFIADRGPAPCGVTLPEKRVPASFTTSHRGSDTITIIYPAKVGPPPPCEPDPCPPPPEDPEEAAGQAPCPPPPPCTSCGSGGAVFGEPHVLSFDGLSYDAQVLGEYLVAESADHGVRIVARFERARTGIAQPFQATSTTGISFEVDGRQIEIYARPYEVRVDGKTIDIPPNVSTAIGAGITLSTSPEGELSIKTPYFEVETSTFYSPMFSILHGLNVHLHVPQVGSLRGMFGSNNANPGDDLQRRDGTSITLAQALAHDVDFYSFSDSWRLTDIADSPFTIADDGFDDENEPRPDSASLAPFRAEALALLGGTTEMCAGAFADGARIIDILAIELAIGMQPEDLDQYSCGYDVSGNVRLAAPSIPALGVVVTVDAVGLQPCVTTTTADGRYRCTLRPDLAEIEAATGAATPVAFPLTMDVSVAAPGTTTTIKSTTGSFLAKAAFGTTSSIDVDLTLDAGSVSTLVLNGTLTEYSEPFVRYTGLTLNGTDASGDEVLNTSFSAVPTSDGTFSQAVVVPASLSTADVVWNIGLVGQDRPTATLTGFASGANTKSVTLDHSPPTLDVSGTSTYNGTRSPSFALGVFAQLAGGGTWQVDRWISDIAPDGSYSAQIVLPDDAVSVSLRASHGDSRNTVVTADVGSVPTSGRVPVDFDVVVGAPIIHASGSMRLNGAPYTDATYVRIDVVRETGAPYTIREYVPASAQARYDATFVLVDNAVSATVTVEIGASPLDHPSTPVADLSDGLHQFVFDAALSAPRLDVTGRLTASGVPARNETSLRVQSAGPGAIDRILVVEPDVDGSYRFSIQLPVDATSATVTALVGFGVADQRSITTASLVAGANPLTFDVSFAAAVVRVSGRLRDHGAPITTRRYVDMRGLDSGGVLRTPVSTLVQPGPDGSYSFDEYFPIGTATVQLAARIGPSTNDNVYATSTALAAGANDIVLDDDYVPPVLGLSGTFTSGGVPVGGNQYIEVISTLSNPDGAPTTAGEYVRPFLDLATGAYAIDVVLPRRAVSVTVIAHIGPDAADYPTLAGVPVGSGRTPLTFGGDIPLPVDVDFNGLLGGNGFAYTEQSLFVIRAFDAAGGRLVDHDTSFAATPDAAGKIRRQLVFDASVARIDVDWRVGISGEAPITRTFTALRPGTNTILFKAFHAPAVITVSGPVTLNGQAYTKPVTYRITAANGTPTPWTKTVAATPMSGAVSFTETLPRGAVTVTVVADIGNVLDPTPTVTRGLVAGANAVSLPIAMVGPSLHVSGTMQIGGAKPPNPVQVDVIASATDHATFTIPIVVSEFSDAGAYQFDAVLPTWAIGAELVARIGPSSSGWVHRNLTGLGPNDRAVVFDAVIAAQRIDITGRVSVGADPFPGPVTLRLMGTLTAGGTYPDSLVVQPDAQGNYSVQYVPMASTSTLEVTADVYGTFTFARPSQSFGDLGVGVNSLAFDVALPGRAVAVTGTIRNRGVAVSGALPLQVRTYGLGTAPLPVVQPFVTPSSVGAFSTLMLVPADTTRIELATKQGVFENDRVWQSFGPLTDGVNDGFVFDDDYQPTAIHLSGTLTRDGAPITARVYFEVLWVRHFEGSGTNTESRLVEVTPGSNGSYTLDAVGPRLADTAIARLTIGANTADYPRTPDLALVAGTVTTTAFDVAYNTTRVRMTGVMTFHGLPVTSETIRVFARDSGGSSIGNFITVGVDNVDATGAYDVTFAVPAQTESISAAVELGNSGADLTRFALEVDTTPGGTTMAPPWNLATTSIDVSGTVTGPDGAWANEDVVVAVTPFVGSVAQYPVTAYTGTNGAGAYSTTVFLPAGTTSVTFDADLPGVAPRTLGPVVDGETRAFVVDLTTLGGTPVVALMTLTLDGAHLLNLPEAKIVGYSAEDNGDGPFVGSAVSAYDVAVTPVGDGSSDEYTVTGVVDVESRFVQFEITFADQREPDTIYRRAFDLTTMTPDEPIEFAIDHSATRLQLSGRFTVENVEGNDPPQQDCTYLGNDSYPLHVTAEAWMTDVYDPATRVTLPLDTYLFRTDSGSQFSPDDAWDLAIAVPAGARNVVVYFSSDLHRPETIDVNYGVLYELHGDGNEGPIWTETGQYVHAECVGQPMEPPDDGG